MSKDEQRWADIEFYNTSEVGDEGVMSVAADVTDGFDESGNVRYFTD